MVAEIWFQKDIFAKLYFKNKKQYKQQDAGL